MINARTIHEYLDGTIDPATETSLFHDLASDPDARRELNDQIRLHLGVKKDMAAIAVPPSATAAIFTELGYAVPNGAVVPPPATSPWRRRSALLLLLLLCFGVGSLLTRYFWPRVEFAEQATTTATMPATALPGQSAVGRPTQTRHSTSSAPSEPLIAVDASQQPRSTPIADDNTPISEEVVSAPSADQIILTASPQSFRSTPQNAHSVIPTASAQSMLGDGPTVGRDASAWRAFAYGLANVASDPFTASEVSGGTAFSQFQVGVTFDLTPEHRVAIKGGRQVMPQEFTRFEDGRDVVYRQTPTLWWAGAMYEHSFADLRVGEVFEPYASVTLGFMQTGPMGRIGTGFHVFPHQQLSFDIGVEATSMLYPIQSVYYTSTTWSITYGIRYHF